MTGDTTTAEPKLERSGRGESDSGGCCEGSERGPDKTALDICCGSERTRAAAATDASEARSLEVEFLYLDLSTCGRCSGTDKALDEAVAEVSPILETTAVDLHLEKIHVGSEQQARDLAFVISPTIRIDGRDIQPEIEESLCEDCGDLCGDSCDCRVWRYRGKTYTAPPKALIVEAILRALYGGAGAAPKTAEHRHEVPDNLKRFFAGVSS
jgi:hypothetical protein